MRKAGAGVAALLLIIAIAWARWYTIFGVEDPGGPCKNRLGCKSQMCASHERRGGALVPSDGYCTRKCAVDADCPAGHHCEPTGPELHGDIPGVGIPDHLCVRVK